MRRTILQTDALHLVDNVAYLHAIGPDILHRGSPHLPRDEREVLHAEPALLYGIGDEVVAHLTGSHLHQHLILRFAEQPYALDGRLEDDARVVAQEEQIASAADMEHGQVAVLPADSGKPFAESRFRVVGQQHAGFSLDAESVELQQGSVEGQVSSHISSDAKRPFRV